MAGVDSPGGEGGQELVSIGLTAAGAAECGPGVRLPGLLKPFSRAPSVGDVRFEVCSEISDLLRWGAKRSKIVPSRQQYDPNDGMALHERMKKRQEGEDKLREEAIRSLFIFLYLYTKSTCFTCILYIIYVCIIWNEECIYRSICIERYVTQAAQHDRELAKKKAMEEWEKQKQDLKRRLKSHASSLKYPRGCMPRCGY